MGFDAFGASGPQPSGPKFKITQKNGEACLKRVNTGGPIQDVGYKCVPVRDIKKLEDLKSRLEGRDDQRNLSPAAKQATSAPAPTPKRAPAGKEVDLFNDVNVPA
ncbi:MAG: hypothetical protein VKP62_14340, partial [Candidatus Sericytochromatia bacterium]|nr:hypothetical protein [Candidatus Sericytochromatia bacterium]